MDEHVLSCLRATLSPDLTTRTAAEQQLAQLFLHPDAALSLSRLLLDPSVELDLRQSAGVLLQKYISTHWSPVSGTFTEPPTSFAIKAQARPLIFAGLSDPERRIRTAAAFAVSTIAKYDYPDEYPDLLERLVELLRQGGERGVHGGMSVVKELVREELGEEQLLVVVRDLAPELLRILGSPGTHAAPTRAATVNVFRQIVRMLETVKEEHPAAVKHAMDGMTPQWLGAFEQLLGTDAAQEVQANWEALGVRVEIYLTLLVLHNTFPRFLASYLPRLLALSLQNLQALFPLYRLYYLSTDPEAPEPPSASSDTSFGAPKTSLEDLGCGIFDFLTPVVRQKGVAEALVAGAQATELAKGLIQSVLDWTQVSKASEEEWADDPNAFVMDDDEETEQYGLRLVGHDFTGSFIDRFSQPIAAVVNALIPLRLQESSDARARGDPDWWKSLEALLALLGGLADDIRDLLEGAGAQGPAPIDLGVLFDQVIPGLLDASDTPFLQGRAFVFASQFASLLPPQLAGQYLDAAVHVLSSDAGVPVKLSAVKTLRNFCRHLPAALLQPHSRHILSLLLPLVDQTSAETLYLLLETVRAVVQLDTALLTPESTAALARQIWTTWEAHSTDPVLTAIAEELVEALAAQPEPAVVRALVDALSPALAQAIAEPPTEETLHVPSEAIQLANALLRPLRAPLPPPLVDQAGEALLATLGRTDDMEVVQQGMIYLTLLVRKDFGQLAAWRSTGSYGSALGTDGIHALFNLLARFLAPTFSESGSVFVGELIMHLFRKAGPQMGPVLPDLARAVVQRLVGAKLPSFIQSLVLPFAYLFSTDHTLPVLDLLSSFSVTTPSGESIPALHVVLEAWVEHSETITGSWNIRVSSLGLGKLFAHCAAHPDPRLESIRLKGEMIIDAANRDTIMTRSRARAHPPRYTEVGWPVKALKLVLKDIQALESGAGPSGSGGSKGKGKGRQDPDLDFELEEDDGDDEWDDDDPLGEIGAEAGNGGEFQFLSDWLDAGAESTAQDDDADLREDPLAQLDVGAELKGVVRAWYASDSQGLGAGPVGEGGARVRGMVEGLTDGEKGILRGVLTL